jgi:type IV pilus assembly protein PilY1
MKTTIQLAASTLALAGLLVGVASHATNLAELPLKASVLAKPNVILGMDDSGSMDSEILLNTSDGVFWWNYDTGRGWDSGVFYRHINLNEYWSSTWRRYFYLFPNGNGTGLNIKPDDPNGDWALPPTSEFGWARSSDYNPQYYNPAVTYTPWATAQGYAAFADATNNAARGHPLLGGAANTVDLTATRSASQLTSRYFIAVNGMTLPAGASVAVCNGSNSSCASWAAVGASDLAAQSSKVTRLAMDYWPATYWVKAAGIWDCTLPAATVSVAARDCAPAPDGTRLRRIEIRSTVTSYPSGRSYANELKNFANWFQYHRKRRLSANGAMGEVLEGMTGLNMGVIKFNSRPADGTRVTMYDLDKTDAALNGKAVLKILYETDSNVATPTRETLKRIGHEFLQTDGPIKYACQRNAALILTDGYAGAVDVLPPAYNAATYGTGAPYATVYGGTLADIALSYYTNTLGDASFPTGKVPAGSIDTNTNLHMNTYGLILGAKGDLFVGENTAVPTSTGAWVDHTTDFNPVAVDDLWHATVVGRGKMYLATAANETASKLVAAFNDILYQDGAQGGVAVSAVNLDRSDGKAYLGYYNPRGWVGDLEARSIDASSAVISSTLTWSASNLLGARVWSGRTIFTSSGSAGVAFDSAHVGATVNPDTSLYTNDQVVEYLRGNRAGEGTLFRTRSGLLGPVVNAEPVLAARDERTVYVASGDGALHAFDTLDGSEVWAYVPPDVLTNLGKSVQRGWVYNTLLDATPSYARLSSGAKMLVGGLGAAGRSYYALNVSSPRGLSATEAAAQFRWIFPTTADATNRGYMGYTVGKPVFARTAADGDVVLVTSGYDNGLTIGDGKGRLWMLSATTGAVIKSFVTSVGTAGTAEAGLAQVAAFKDPDGNVQYAYGGDLLGNVWKFDLTTTGAGPHTPTKLAVLKDGAATPNLQPVTSAPELVMIGGQRVVLIGTGRVLDIGDFGSTKTQTFYAIADGASLANARSGLTAKVYSRGSNPEISGSAVNWSTGRGWYIDIPAGEQVNTDPVVAYGAVVFVGNKNGGSDCSQQSYLYIVDVGSGAAVTGQTTVSQSLSGTATSSRMVVVRSRSGQLYGVAQLSDRTRVRTLLPMGATITPAKNAWRELRR